jgi:hypothetical protein
MNIKQFLQERIWAHLPDEVSRKTRLWAAVLWSGALMVLGVLLALGRAKHGMAPGVAPYGMLVTGLAVGMVLLAPGVGATFYLWVLRILAIPGFVLSVLLLMIGFYLIVTPMGLLMRLGGKDFLRTSARSGPQWVEHPGNPDRKRYFRLI